MSNVVSLHTYKQMKAGIDSVSKSVSIVVTEDKNRLNSRLNIVFACSDLIDSINSSIITRLTLLPVALILRGIRKSYLKGLYRDIKNSRID